MNNKPFAIQFGKKGVELEDEDEDGDDVPYPTLRISI